MRGVCTPKTGNVLGRKDDGTRPISARSPRRAEVRRSHRGL